MKIIKSALFAALLVLAACAAYLPAAARAQTPEQEKAFNFDPGEGVEVPGIERSVETSFEDGEIVNHPIYGTVVISKNRWKNWVARALYLTLLNVALLTIMLSISKAEEHSIIIAYVLSGASFSLSLWIFLCAVLLFRLDSLSWLYVTPISAVTGFLSHVVLMKVKRSDISLSELKESFQKMSKASPEDQRLVSVDGAPGDWPEQDFLK